MHIDLRISYLSSICYTGHIGNMDPISKADSRRKSEQTDSQNACRGHFHCCVMNPLCHFCLVPWQCSPCCARSEQPQTRSPGAHQDVWQVVLWMISSHSSLDEELEMILFIYLGVLQVTLNILDELSHCLLQTSKELLLTIKHFISDLSQRG